MSKALEQVGSRARVESGVELGVGDGGHSGYTVVRIVM